MTTVSFQGIAGAYSEEAIRQFFGPQVESLPCRTFSHVFVTVEQGTADFGMLPIENSVAGCIHCVNIPNCCWGIVRGMIKITIKFISILTILAR